MRWMLNLVFCDKYFDILIMCRRYKQQSCKIFNIQMVQLGLESWTSQWCHLVRRVKAQVLMIQSTIWAMWFILLRGTNPEFAIFKPWCCELWCLHYIQMITDIAVAIYHHMSPLTKPYQIIILCIWMKDYLFSYLPWQDLNLRSWPFTQDWFIYGMLDR